MKVPSSQPQRHARALQGRVTKETGHSPAEAAHASRGSEEAAKVRVSTGARALADSRRPEEPDAARIDRLKNAIEDGTFQVDAGQVADRMIAEELE